MKMALLFPLLAGCMNLEGFIHGGIPCSTVSEATCTGPESAWDAVCTTCDEPYDWAQDWDWMPGTLAEGESVRTIDATTVVQQSVATDDGLGTLDLYYIPSHGEDPELAQTTLLYQHGNYAGIEPYLPRLRFLHEAGYAIVVWDYRGYGKSLPAEAPTADQFLADAVQIRGVAAELAPDPNRVVTYGYSVGAIPTVEMAVKDPGCATVLEAPFTSLATIAASNSGASVGEQFFSEGGYDNVSKIAGYQGPLLVMTGTLDNKFPIEDVEELYAAAPGPKQLWALEGVYHGISNGGVPEDGLDAYFATMRTFFEEKAPGCVTL